MTSTPDNRAVVTAAGYLALALVFLHGCSGEMPDTGGARTVTASGDVEPLGADQSDLARRAAALLAGELNVPIQAVRVDSVRAVEWRDGSIGCPQPGEQYQQVITPGHRVSLRVDGTLHFVHEANGRLFRCQRQKAVAGTTRQLELVWGEQAIAAREDLARRLAVDAGQVLIVSAEKTTWSDASLGCPEPGNEYTQGNLDGYVLTLRHGSRNYTYHTDFRRVIPCPPISEN